MGLDVSVALATMRVCLRGALLKTRLEMLRTSATARACLGGALLSRGALVSLIIAPPRQAQAVAEEISNCAYWL